MRGFERVKELLRTFVDSKAWDFCVIWKLGDDPSRFIEWVGCCCNGGYDADNIKVENIKEEEEEEEEGKKLGSICRDEHKKHPVRTLACQALSHFPLFMPLYSGIHGEVAMSKLPKWLLNHQGNGSNPGAPNEIWSTQVLVPVNDGLIELFSTKIKPVDEKMVDLIVSRCNAFLSDNPGFKSQLLVQPFPEHNLPTTRVEEQCTSAGINFSFDGSSSGSNPSSEAQPSVPNAVSSLQGSPVNCRHDDSSVSERSKCREVFFRQEQPRLVYGNVFLRDSGNKATKKLGRENYKSKNLVTERNRRHRINHGIYTLRALVPKITKMDKAGTLNDAIDYINELHEEKKKLQDELMNINETAEEKSADSTRICQTSFPVIHRLPSGLNKKIEVNLEVHKIGERDFFIRGLQEHTRDGFQRLIEATGSLGLEIIGVNVTRLNCKVTSVLNVKANRDGIAAGRLRELLLMMITSENHPVEAESTEESG